MFRNLQCVQKGRVHLPDDGRAAAVFADDYGGAWVLSADRQDLYYYTGHTLSTAMEEQASALPSYASPVGGASCASAAASPSPPSSTLAFRCTSEDDGVHTVLFFNSSAAAAAEEHRRDACVVTCGGAVALIRVPAARDALPTLLQPYQEVHLDLRVSAATTMPGAVVLCCFDGAFTEVVRTVVVGEVAVAAPSSGAAAVAAVCPHHGDAAMSDAICTCAVEVTGLFRVEGRIACVVYDGVHNFLVAVSDAGNVDVWDVVAGCDATARCGSPSWETARYGTATCAVVCRDALWVGLTSGHLLILPLVAGGAAVERVLRSHSSPLTDLVTMSMESSVWSCALGSGKVNVWGAVDASFRGSFVFPGSGVQALCIGASQLRTALWGIDGASGEPCLSQMTETLSLRQAVVCGSGDLRALEISKRLLDAYRRCWARLLRHFVSPAQHEKAAAAEGEGWRSGAAVDALEALEKDEGGVDDVRGAVGDVVALAGAVQRLCAMHQRVRGDDDDAGHSSPSAAAVVDDVLRDWQRCLQEREGVAEFLRSVRALQQSITINSSSSGGGVDGHTTAPVCSLEDAAEFCTQLQAQVAELTTALAATVDSGEVDARIDAAVDEATERLQREMAELQDAVQDAEARAAELQTQLRAAEADVEAAQERQAAVERVLEETEAELDDTRRALLASKRAAEVRAAEGSSLFDMEAKLHASQHIIDELSAQAEVSLKDAAGTKEELAALRRRETAFKDVLRRVLQTQNTVADGVRDLADAADASLADAERRAGTGSSVAAKEALRAVAEGAFRLDAAVEARLEEQVRWFHTLSHELRADLP